MRVRILKSESPESGRSRRVLRGPVRFVGAFAVCALLFGVAPGAVHADLFKLKDGRRIEGTVVREIGSLISIKTSDGVITLDKTEIRERVIKKTPFDEYRERVKEIAETDLAGNLALAKWCEGHEMTAEATLHYKAVVAIAPDHEGARVKLGYVWIAGDWFLEGPAAEARRAELEAIEVDDIVKLPDSPDSDGPTDEEIERTLPPLPVGAKTLALKLDEKIGKEKPKSSGVAHQINKYCRQMTEPLRVSPSADPTTAPFVIEVKVRTYFVRTVSFYNAPLNNIFQGEVQAKIYQRQPNGVLKAAGTIKFSKPYSLSCQVDKKKASQSAYYATIEEFGKKLRATPFFRKRGVK